MRSLWRGGAAALVAAAGLLGFWIAIVPATELPPIMPDESTFTQGTSPVLMPLGCFYNTSISNLSSGQSGAAQCTTDRKLVVSIPGAVTLASNSSVNLTQIDGTAAVTAGVNGTLAIGGNQAAGGNISSNVDPLLIAGSDYGGTPALRSLKIDSSGLGHVSCDSGCSSTGGTNATDEATFTQGTSAYNPIGGTYNTSNTNLMSGQGGVARMTTDRKLIVMPYETTANLVSGTASTTGTSSTSVIGSAGTGLKNCIGGGLVANTSSTDSLITIQDGSGGNALAYTVAPAKNGMGGSNFTLSPPICGSAATGVYFQAGAAATTIYITLTGFKSP
jgi:hypothetical protein